MNKARAITMEIYEGNRVNVEIGEDLAHSEIAWMIKIIDVYLTNEMIENQHKKGEFELWELGDRGGDN